MLVYDRTPSDLLRSSSVILINKSDVGFFSGNSSILYRLTEYEIHSRRLPHDIGTRWKDLARELGFKEAFINATESDKDCNKECCIALLVKWMGQEGEGGATREKLGTALTNIGLQTVADKLIGMWSRLCIKPKPEQNSTKITPGIDYIIIIIR